MWKQKGKNQQKKAMKINTVLTFRRKQKLFA